MGGFKRLCLAVWSLAGVFTLAALGLTIDRLTPEQEEYLHSAL